ncbi:hypothetical protein CCMSSC00406_0005674 [Pleurotus cornucopiae]|uniref:Uncharacterized protein n=1 Tax=Pleurotus cornucopiae TaxID=5321 RepID=A0ACB7IUH0_PLECO|nr:hypothetical protein CCMSSC00406_0005674 [Pleurotus cornucopiae]
MSETQGPLGAPGTLIEREDPVNNFSDADDWRNLGISMQAPTWEVLSIALRNQSSRNWKDYVVFIRYGSAENRIERCLSWDERPLAKFMKLKDAGKDPVFVLKGAESLPSPIAIARQKIATRSAGSHADNDIDHPRISLLNDTSLGSSGERTMGQGSSYEFCHSHGSAFSTSTAVEILSYAVAVYPYSAEQGDELNVAVGDTFVVSSRDSGWLVVQRDPTGSGTTADSELSVKGRIPKGCVLETNMPVASAIAEATAPDPNRPQISASNGPASPRIAAPILSRSILTTSAQGIASMDYQRNGDWEIDLSSGDALRVFKRHAHWLYVVKTDGGGRGWVPSWVVGKVKNRVAPSSAGVKHLTAPFITADGASPRKKPPHIALLMDLGTTSAFGNSTSPRFMIDFKAEPPLVKKAAMKDANTSSAASIRDHYFSSSYPEHDRWTVQIGGHRMEEYHIVAKYAPDLLKQYIWDEDTGLVLQEYETRLVKETDPLGNIED